MSAEPKPTRPAWLFDGIGIGCGMLIGGVCLCGGLGAISNFVDGALMQVFPKSRQAELDSLVAHQRGDVHILAVSIAMYSNDHHDRWPANLELVRKYLPFNHAAALDRTVYLIPPYATTAKTPADYIVATEVLADQETVYIHGDFHVTVGLKPD